MTSKTPLFMTEGGDDKLANMRKELTVFLNLCSAERPSTRCEMFDNRVVILLQPCDANDATVKWYNQRETVFDVYHFLDTKSNAKVNGKIWCCGFLGSRWADTTINEKKVRLAFYSKKYNPNIFAQLPDEEEKKDYLIMVCVF